MSLNINIDKRLYHGGSSNNLFLDQGTEDGGSPHVMSPHLNPNHNSNAAVINLKKMKNKHKYEKDQSNNVNFPQINLPELGQPLGKDNEFGQLDYLNNA